MHQVLDDFDELLQMLQLQEDNHSKVLSNIKIYQLKSEKNYQEKRYEVQVMTAEILQEYLISLEQDY